MKYRHSYYLMYITSHCLFFIHTREQALIRAPLPIKINKKSLKKSDKKLHKQKKLKIMK